jgi:hypothetical protein
MRISERCSSGAPTAGVTIGIQRAQLSCAMDTALIVECASVQLSDVELTSHERHALRVSTGTCASALCFDRFAIQGEGASAIDAQGSLDLRAGEVTSSRCSAAVPGN